MTAPASGPSLAITRACRFAAVPIDARQHTMNARRLFRYLEIKIHHLIQDHDWASIRVVGEYDRGCVISANEKNDKSFNWQRPTAEIYGNDLVIKCFPGVDYVRHYALIIATYLNMTGRYRAQVHYQLPGEPLCRAAIGQLDFDASAVDLIVVGWGLGRLAGGGSWTQGNGYAWQRADIDGHRVLYLGYLHSIWGDVASRVVSRLAALGARRVVYVGKVGSLDPQIAPNTCLATGTSSVLASPAGQVAGFLRRPCRLPAGRPPGYACDLTVGTARRQDLAGQASRRPVRGPGDRPHGPCCARRRHRVRVPAHHLQQPGPPLP